MDVAFERSGTALIVRLKGRSLDARSAGAAAEKIGARLAAGENRIAVDMTAVAFLDSSGLGTLVRLLGQAPSSGRMLLFGCGTQVLRVIQQSRLDRVLLAYPGEAEALKALASE
jgi:anti-sigma B factor antagonist